MKSFLFELTPETGVCRAPSLGRMPAENLGAAVAAAIGLMAPDGKRIRTVSIIGEGEPFVKASGDVHPPAADGAFDREGDHSVIDAPSRAAKKARPTGRPQLRERSEHPQRRT